MQTKVLRRTNFEEEYRLYQAALEWDLVEPIVIDSADDLKSAPKWRDRMSPFHHQVTNLITFCRRLPVTLLADDVGLGKTISAGLIASELISRARLSKILIVCPKLLGPQWKEELESKFNIDASVVTGRALLKADFESVGAVITTYHSARLYLDELPQDRFQMLILDEAHKLRNLFGTPNPPMVATTFKRALEERRFRFVLMLTATPIQNRLWDLYSLVDLLTVARGHKNPFGTEGEFARRYIADARTEARQLKLEARDAFRSVVYGYMSRVRRGDANLYFPERIIHMRKVPPSSGELALIDAIAKPIQEMNKLAQISILQALASSPDALLAQLRNMARNGTVKPELAQMVGAIVGSMRTTSKLEGLEALIRELSRHNPNDWRLVVFTGRLETQTTIQSFLEKRDLTVGIINGSSGLRNQETLAGFRATPPKYRVIVSTEAGSEGVNLQVANVLVNYDLPWNPMIVEQRIGRIQRLASKHANVAIYNMMLSGTFEEYIVGRLMVKLQMAAHAIGDIESLLEAASMNGDDEGHGGFDEQIRRLVVAALAKADMAKSTQLIEASIDNAKAELVREETNINEMLGGMEGTENLGPRTPRLPTQPHSMDGRTLVVAGLRAFGAKISEPIGDQIAAEQNGLNEHISFVEPTPSRHTPYYPGAPAFQRLVSRLVNSPCCLIHDADEDSSTRSKELATNWCNSLDAALQSVDVVDTTRFFTGEATVKVRAVVAHDSYERLVVVPCSPSTHNGPAGRSGAQPLPPVIESPVSTGINLEAIENAAMLDEGISEFRRFYLERRQHEMAAAGSDDRRRKKLDDDFTPRMEMTLVALKGNVHREVKCRAYLEIEGHRHEVALDAIPSSRQLRNPPTAAKCAISGKLVPELCLQRCDISSARALPHLLVESQISGRKGLPIHSSICMVSGRRALTDELELSARTNRLVAKEFLKTSAVSKLRAEVEHFVRCEFSGAELLIDEAAISEISGKRYRTDQGEKCFFSSKAGHTKEFFDCFLTQKRIAVTEAEICELTAERVRVGLLERCSVTGKRVLPTQLGLCTVTKKLALNSLLVSSSVSETKLLESAAIHSRAGRHCTPAEAKFCTWSGQKIHPEDERICVLTSLPMSVEFVTDIPPHKLDVLMKLLSGTTHAVEHDQLWPVIESHLASVIGKGESRIQAAAFSPSKKVLAICVQVKTLLGFRVRHAGLLYALHEREIVGRLAMGRRDNGSWRHEI